MSGNHEIEGQKLVVKFSEKKVIMIINQLMSEEVVADGGLQLDVKSRVVC